jgi:Leucine-rich repeat (LRR) protein
MITLVNKNSYWWLIFGFVVVVFLGNVGGKLMASQERIIHFPRDRSIGNLYVVDRVYPTDDFWAWLFAWETKWLGEARGDMKVPANKWLRLDVSEKAWSRPRPFDGLKPNDIQILNFFTYKGADASVLEDVEQLTALEVLNLAQTETIETGLRYLTSLKKLKYLYLPGHVRTDELAHLSKLTSLEFLHIEGPMVTDVKAAHIGKITSLTQLNLTGSEIGSGLVHLKGLKSLRYLNLRGNRSYDIDDDLVHLVELTELEELDLQNTLVGDAGLARLAGMKKIKRLYLRSNPASNKITDSGLVHLKELKSLEELVLPFTGITDAGLAQLVGLDSLKKLEAFGDGITDKGLSELAKMKSLEDLGIRSDSITDAGMIELSKCARLKALQLNDCAVTDVGLAQLAKLKLLTKLNINKTQVSGDGLAVLKELPLLTDLTLLQVHLGETGLAYLEGLPSLEKLWLAYPDMNIGDKEITILSSLVSLKELDVRLLEENITEPFTDKGFVYLSKLTALKRLQLSGNKMLTDKSLKSLSNLTALENIHMYQCNKVTNAGLKHLEGLAELKWLYLGNSQVTKEGMLGLKEKIPALNYRL